MCVNIPEKKEKKFKLIIIALFFLFIQILVYMNQAAVLYELRIYIQKIKFDTKLSWYNKQTIDTNISSNESQVSFGK